MPATNFTFRGLRPTGWTASSLVPAPPTLPLPRDSVIGSTNAAAQNPVSAQTLMTTPQTLRDPALGSRTYMNPNTGIRDVVASGSVYAQSDVPAFLSQAVQGLNAEQSLQRSLQAEWNNRLMQGAMSGQPDAYLWQEALRAASVSPGASVAFGGAVMDPAAGRAQELVANTQARAAQQLRSQQAQQRALQSQIQRLTETSSSGIAGSQSWMNQQNQIASLQSQLNSFQPQRTVNSPSGWRGIY